MNRLRVLAVAAGAVVIGGVDIADAAPKAEFAVVVHTTFDDVPDEFEDGTLDGCETGTVETITQGLAGTPWGGHFTGWKVFECAGSEGGFTVSLSANFGADGSAGTWTVISSWGTQSGLRGRGTLVGEPVSGGIDDFYTGWVS